MSPNRCIRPRHMAARRLFHAGAIAAIALLAGCGDRQQQSQTDEIKKDLDQLVQTTKDLSSQVKEIANQSKTSADGLKALTARLDAMDKSLSGALAQQKRGALYLQLDVDAACDNDEQCVNTARALCNRISYPSAITSRFTPGVRPTLHSLVCFD